MSRLTLPEAITTRVNGEKMGNQHVHYDEEGRIETETIDRESNVDSGWGDQFLNGGVHTFYGHSRETQTMPGPSV